MKRMRLSGWVIVACAATVGCGGSSLSSDAGTGIVLTTPPPFSIPTAPAASELRPCGANVGVPWAIGFLSDGRALVGASVDHAGPGATQVSAWDSRSNTLDTLFISSVRLPASTQTSDAFAVSKDGKRILERRGDPAYRIYDVEAGSFLSNEPIAADVAAISGDGHVLLDSNLLSRAPDATPLVDFRPLLPDDLRVPGYSNSCVHALTFDGGAVALGTVDAMNAPQTVVLYADGRVVRLPDSPGYEGWDHGACGLDWSTDGRRLLQFSGGGLRMWDLTTGALTARSDDSVRRAAFVSDGDRLLTAHESGIVIERDLSLAPLFTTTVGGDFAFGPDGRILGWDASGFGVLYHGNDLGHWPNGGGGWLGAVALRDIDSFMLWSDIGDVTDAGSPFGVSLDRYVQAKGGSAASFRSDKAQSEWRGDLALAPDESRLGAVFPDLIVILDPVTLAPLARIETTAGTIAWSPDGRYLAATPDLHYRDSGRTAYVPAPEIIVWEAATGKLARRFVAPAYATHVAFAKDGARLVGSGYPGMLRTSKAPADLSPPPAPITSFIPSGDPIAFEIDVRSGTVSTSALPAFVGATRELIATPSNIVAISTGAPIATLASPVIASGVFSGDFSMLLATEDLDASQSTDTHLISVADGHVVASLQTFWGSYAPALALSRNGRRVQLDYEIYCLVDRP